MLPISRSVLLFLSVCPVLHPHDMRVDDSSVESNIQINQKKKKKDWACCPAGARQKCEEGQMPGRAGHRVPLLTPHGSGRQVYAILDAFSLLSSIILEGTACIVKTARDG